MSIRIKELRTLTVEIVHRLSGSEVQLIAEVEQSLQGDCRMSYSHAGRGKLDGGPWFSDSLGVAKSWKDALLNFDVLAKHIEASYEVVTWKERLVRG